MFKYKVLKFFYKLSPFSLSTCKKIFSKPVSKKLTIAIATYEKRAKELHALFVCLQTQNYNWCDSEIIVVCDRGGSDRVEDVCTLFPELPISYSTFNSQGSLGAIRNRCYEESSGEFILILDDDALALSDDFLSNTLKGLSENNVVLFKGVASFSDIETKSSSITEYTPATRCVLYPRKIVEDIGGFNEKLRAYEDIDHFYRSLLNNADVDFLQEEYIHPPELYTGRCKSVACGVSVRELLKSYSLIFWLLIFANEFKELIKGIITFDVTLTKRKFWVLAGIIMGGKFFDKDFYV